MKTEIEETFNDIDKAMQWLNSQSGLWGGLSQELWLDLEADLASEGETSIRTPLGVRLIAICT